ncbi:hypothetical protein [Mycobacterium rhizamassiliense]|uniref:hypothetical protein n=1 Tax=Mycobacterium rhizamassiliense TaxID=1841860 RepID=UPI00268EFE5F
MPLPPATPPSAGKDHVEGMVRSVSGGVIQLRTRSGSATVDFAPATMVTEAAPAKLADVKPGSCVSARAAQPGQPAQTVKISPAVNGSCLPPPEATSGGTPAPAQSGAPTGVFGQVTSVSPNTIAMNTLAPGGKVTPVNVPVGDSTTYSNDAVTNGQAITDGKCMAAQGTEGDGGLKATAVSLQPCPPMGGHHHHLPHLPIHLPFHI